MSSSLGWNTTTEESPLLTRTYVSTWRSRVLKGEVTIPLYSIIFLLAVVGNLLVITTIVQHKRMRTITNVFLLNLSVSDLLLAVFCMPFTLVPTLMQDFVFGKAVCILVRYMQGTGRGFLVHFLAYFLAYLSVYSGPLCILLFILYRILSCIYILLYFFVFPCVCIYTGPFFQVKKKKYF